MGGRTTLASMLSYWLYYVALILIAFVVSPILVHGLGAEGYGLWTLLVSITGYLAVLDLGVNAAVVRLVSMHMARGETGQVRAVYSTSFAVSAVLGALGLFAVLGIGLLFLDLFPVEVLSPGQARVLFLVVGIDLAVGLLFSVFLGALTGLQQFVKVNVLSTAVAVLRSVLLVALLLRGHGIVTVALVHLVANVLKYAAQYALIRRGFAFLRFARSDCTRAALGRILGYSAYGFLIAVALKVLAHTDAFIIGRFVSVAEVTFYAVPAGIVDHVEKLVLAGIAVLIPLISSRDAVGDVHRNRSLYVQGTKVTLLSVLPVLFALFTVGDDFLRLWMGVEFEARSTTVLRILVCGYLIALPQLVAHGILKGTSNHRGLATVLCAQAALNVGLSLILVREHGIEGVSLGTAVPLWLSNLVLIPVATCRLLAIPYLEYLRRSHLAPLLILVGLSGLAWLVPVAPESYAQLVLYAAVVVVLVAGAGWLFAADRETRARLWSTALRVAGRRG